MQQQNMLGTGSWRALHQGGGCRLDRGVPLSTEALSRATGLTPGKGPTRWAHMLAGWLLDVKGVCSMTYQ